MSLAPYWFLVVVRIALTLLPQTGYVHPDEYFQSVEVVVGDVLQVEAFKPWEFNTTSPIRSISVPYVVVGSPLMILKYVAPFCRLWFDWEIVTPYTVLTGPRLVACLLSFITDLCMYKICRLYGQNHKARMLILGSSYVVLVYGTRTFSNSIEMALTSLLIFLVAQSMAKTDQVIYEDEKLRECYNRSKDLRERIHLHRTRLSLPWHTFSNVFLIATVTVVGVFNRPTFLAFAFPPIFFWLQRGFGSNLIGITDFNMRVLALIVSSIPALTVMVLADSMYYGFLTLDLIVQKNVSIVRDLVFTPYNFIKYNMNTTNLAVHGIHPRVTHFLVNVPLLYNVLGIAGICSFVNLIYRGFLGKYSSLPRVQSIIGLMTASFVIPIALLSVFPHQEPRFIIPVTFPLVFLYSQLIRPTSKVPYNRKAGDTNIALSIWYLLNISLTLFYGFVHQAGIYPVLVDLHNEMQVKPKLVSLHLATSHVYSLPVSLLLIKQGRLRQVWTETGSRYRLAKDFFAYEFQSSLSVEMAAIKLHKILQQCETAWTEKRLKYRLYYVTPSSLAASFQAAAFEYNMTASVSRVFYPHLTTEAPPSAHFERVSCSFQNLHDCSLNTSVEILHSSLKFVSDVVHQTGLTLFRVTPIHLEAPTRPPPLAAKLSVSEATPLCEVRSFLKIRKQRSECIVRR